MQFVAALPTLDQDLPAQRVWQWLAQRLGNADGVCYYKYPAAGFRSSERPDLTILVRGYQPLIVRCVQYTLDEIEEVSGESWTIDVNGAETQVDSPMAVVDDFQVWLKQRFERERPLRRKLDAVGIVALPSISRHDFRHRFPNDGFGPNTIWHGGTGIDDILQANRCELNNTEWRIAKSVLQAAAPINVSQGPTPSQADTLGKAIRILDNRIALLDDEQQKVAIQIPPGPQRIRGLAGTGKTVLLAMRAANIHQHDPDARILFTFHTQSLYNQARRLITRFYRYQSDQDPDWDHLQIRHAWGGRGREGVYYDLCMRRSQPALTYQGARAINSEVPFQACCHEALKSTIKPFYDYILVDEAQDFPKEFFELLFRLSRSPHALYWAYDEMQSLSSAEMPKTEDSFGKDAEGRPNVTLDGDDYPGGMEKDFVLHRSYRCPHQVLMLAHAMGLGIHNPRGPVQMLSDEASWNALGYTLESGRLERGQEIVIFRPPANSPNNITDIYQGRQPGIRRRQFRTRDSEIAWIADSIERDVKKEGVAPEQILVISLDARRAKDYMVQLQRDLLGRSIQSTIPGLIDDSAQFAEKDRVTLATVFRAKGNEAHVVYIMSMESLYDFAEEIENRNRAFTAISRSKGWVRITGVGKQMLKVRAEIREILRDLPRFRFEFPDMNKIRSLDASETSRRRKVVKRATEAAQELAKVDAEALLELDPRVRRQVFERFREVIGEDK